LRPHVQYYDDAIITTKCGSMFVNGSPKIVQLDNTIPYNALKQAIGNMISLPNVQVIKDIHFWLLVSFVGDCGKYTTWMLHNDEEVITMFSMFVDISKLTCLELYIASRDPPTQTCTHPPPISTNSFNFEGLNNTLFKQWTLNRVLKTPPNLFDCYSII